MFQRSIRILHAKAAQPGGDQLSKEAADEAKYFIKEEYLRTGYGVVDVTYVSTVQLIGEDYSSHEKYTFDQYKFIVDGSNGQDMITFNSDSGFY